MKKQKFLIIFVFICSIVFCILYYNFLKSGNNINRSQEQIVEDILKEFNNYEANIEVTVKSNKNENKYEMKQVVKDKYSKQEILNPDNIKDLTIELEENKLKILNSKLNMEKIYENYECILNNSLFLNTFSSEFFNNSSKIYEEDEKIVIEIKLPNNSNTYIKYKYLYLDAKSYEPQKLVIKDITQNPYISIIYKDIEIK
jgi:outer membrane lipoprotein-sorting protein